eukprot:2224321-Prymnesium_polylepis.2
MHQPQGPMRGVYNQEYTRKFHLLHPAMCDNAPPSAQSAAPVGRHQTPYPSPCSRPLAVVLSSPAMGRVVTQQSDGTHTSHRVGGGGSGTRP